MKPWKWYRWFAWHPVRTTHGWIWLKTIRRRWLVNPDPFSDGTGQWDYRE